jgi:hypothetical protein
MATLYYNNATGDGNWANVLAAATGYFTFSGQPSDGTTIVIGSTAFEFDSDSSTSYVAVPIGADLAESLANLKSVIEANVAVTATIDGATFNLVANAAGAAGNLLLSCSPDVAASSSYMTGGSDGNWWTDEACTIPATSLPTSSDSVVVTGSLSQNTSGSEPTVVDFTMSGGNWSIAITVTGTATFNGSTSAAYNYGTITGNVTFDGANASNDYTIGEGTVVGNATFQNGANNLSQINGNATFLSGAGNQPYGRRITGDATFVGAYNNGIVEGNATFSFGAYNSPYGSVQGTATFGDGGPYNAGSVQTGVFNDGSSNGHYSDNTLYGNVQGNATFNNAWNYSGVVYGNATFNGYSANGVNSSQYNLPNMRAEVNGTATFNDSSKNEYWSKIGGTATFNDQSSNWASSAVYASSSYIPAFYGPLVFNDDSYNQSPYMQDWPSPGYTITFNDNAQNRGGFYYASSGAYQPNPPTLAFNPSRGINGSSILGVV